jgi:hypothetical protein
MRKNQSTFEDALTDIDRTAHDYIDRVTEKRRRSDRPQNVLQIPISTPAPSPHPGETERLDPPRLSPDPWKGRTLHIREATLETYDDLVERQKRKRRKRQLSPGEAATGQEVADEIFRLGIEQFKARHPD